MDEEMGKFEQVTVEQKANIYYDGKVTSRTIWLPDGTKKTLGIMLPGDYEFSTGLKEEMKIVAGILEYRLPGEDWKRIEGEGVFEVPTNSSFQLKVYEVTDYTCSYLQES